MPKWLQYYLRAILLALLLKSHLRYTLNMRKICLWVLWSQWVSQNKILRSGLKLGFIFSSELGLWLCLALPGTCMKVGYFFQIQAVYRTNSGKRFNVSKYIPSFLSLKNWTLHHSRIVGNSWKKNWDSGKWGLVFHFFRNAKLDLTFSKT